MQMNTEALTEICPDTNGFILAEYVSGGKLHNITQYGLGTGQLTIAYTTEPTELPSSSLGGISKELDFIGNTSPELNQIRNITTLGKMGRDLVHKVDPSDSRIETTEATVAAFDAVDQVRANIFEGIPELSTQPTLLVEYPPGGVIPVEFCMEAYRNRQRAVSSTVDALQTLHDRYAHALVQLTPPGFLELTAKIAEHNLKSDYRLSPNSRDRVGAALDSLQDLPLLDPRIFRPEFAFREPQQDPLKETVRLLDWLVYEPHQTAKDVLGDGYTDDLLAIFADANQRITVYAQEAQAA